MSNPFSIVCESVGGSLARRGTLCIPNRKPIETPAILIDTKAGSIPHLTRDIVTTNLGATAVCLNLALGHFIKFPGTEGLKKMEQNIQEFAALQGLQFPTFLSVQDSLNPIPHEYNDKGTVSVWSPSGRRKVSVQEYTAFIGQAAPDMFESLGDTLQPHAAIKRIDKSICRSIEHLDELINAFDLESSYKLFACLEGGDMVDKRVAMARAIAHRPVAGFSINGLMEDTYRDDVTLLANLLKQIHAALPTDKPKLLHSIGSPVLALVAISNGVDLLDGSYITQLKNKNLALNIPFDNNPREQSTEQHSQTNNIVIDVTNKELREYFKPINTCCPCYTCSHYTCAYLHHLAATKEMLLPMLLMLHNIDQYQRFFSEIREHISKQTFQDYQKKIEFLSQSSQL